MPDNIPKIIAPNTSPKPLFQQSFETQAAIAYLEDVATGTLVAYAALTEAIGVDAQRAGRGAVQSARRYLERGRGMVFAAVMGRGLKRLADAEIVATGAQSLAKSRRASRRAGRRLTCVDFEALDDATKSRQQAYLSLFNAIEVLGRPTAVKKLEARVVESGRLLPLNQTLEAFKK